MKFTFAILSLFFAVYICSFSENPVNEQKYYPLNVGDNWVYFLGDTTEKTFLKFTIVSNDTINGNRFVTTKQEWFKGDSLLYKQEYYQTLENGFVITTYNKKKPVYQIVQQCDGSVKFTESIASKYGVILTEDQKELLLSTKASFTFLEFESGTHSAWEFRNKSEVSKFAENIGLVYLKNENVRLQLHSATIRNKTYKLLQ
jgi:hypothetical protein